MARSKATRKSAAFWPLAGFALAVSLLVAGCGSPESGGSGRSVRIGVVLSLSGDRQTYGQDCLQGIKMAVGLANAMGGVKSRQVELVVMDDSSSAVRTMEAVKELASDETVLGIVGGTSSKLAMAGASAAQELGIPYITPLATNPNVTSIGNFISRICFTDTYQGSALAEYSLRYLKLKRVGVIFDPGDEYSVGLATYFKKHYGEIGGQVAFEIYQTGREIDSTAVVKAIAKWRPEAIFMASYHRQASQLVKLVKRRGLDVVMLGGDGWESPEFSKATADILTENDQVYIATHFSTDNTRPLVKRFVEDYASKHGRLPTAASALGYDAAGVMCDALRKTPQLSRQALSESINSTSSYNGVTGTISLNEKRNPVKEVVILQAYAGKFFFEATVNVR